MQPAGPTRTRSLTVVAQDPSVRGGDGGILCVPAQVPAEALGANAIGLRRTLRT
jgi:hypothetical protein